MELCNFELKNAFGDKHDYHCENSTINDSEKCIFHEQHYLNEITESDVRTQFLNQVDKCFNKEIDLICIGYILPSIDLSDSVFNKSVYFIEAVFSGETYFYGVTFSGKETNFRGAEFLGKDTRFKNTRFASEDMSSFEYAKFLGNETYFTDAEFSSKETDFSNAEFSGKRTYFENAKFSGERTNFIDAKFSGAETNFKSAEFSGNKIDFSDSYFSGNETDFSKTQFSGNEAYFGGVKFLGDKTYFYDAEFSGAETYFGGMMFLGNKTFFIDTKFSGNKTNFEDTEFSGAETYFKSTRFSGQYPPFSNNKFKSGLIDFSDSIFEVGSEFKFTEKSGITLFRKVRFEKQEKIFFEGDLSKVSFLQSDITRIRFSDTVDWGKNSIIYDESLLNDKESEFYKEGNSTTVENILTTYRYLRENYEYFLRYEKAGKFFIREFEVGRMYEDKKRKENRDTIIAKRNRVKRAILPQTWYKVVADYGESYKKPSAILAGLLIGGYVAFLFGFDVGLSIQFHDAVEYAGKIDTINMAGERTIHMVIPYFGMIEKANWLDYLLKIPTIPIFGVLFIALKRKVERRHRH